MRSAGLVPAWFLRWRSHRCGRLSEPAAGPSCGGVAEVEDAPALGAGGWSSARAGSRPVAPIETVFLVGLGNCYHAVFGGKGMRCLKRAGCGVLIYITDVLDVGATVVAFLMG